MTETTQTTDILIGQIEPHPDNPRLFYRQEVVDGIAAQLESAGSYDPAHALLVRPINGHYQIVQGHHRWKAAQQAGLEFVPCWVREMSDDEAYMLLAMGNVQGELSPLEIGIHALKAVEPGDGGRGREGGVREYARQLGKTQPYITQVRQAAEVFATLETDKSTYQFLDKAQHLASIHGADPSLWPMLVSWMIDGDKSVNQVEDTVRAIRKFKIPEPWATVFLPLLAVVESFIKMESPAPKTVEDLAMLASFTQQAIESAVKKVGEKFTYSVEGYHAWLASGMGTYAWQRAELEKYRLEVVKAAQEASKPAEPDAQLGKWYGMGPHLLYCGDTSKPEFYENLPKVAFAFADPPYNAGAAEWDEGFKWTHDWLVDKAKVVAVTPGIAAIQRFFAGETHMPYLWSMSCWIDNGMTRGALGFGNWIYVALFGRDTLHKNAQDIIRCSVKTGETKQTEHKGRKPSEMVKNLLQLFTEPDDTIIDPFLGSGTTMRVAQELGRRCIGGEINPEFCNDIIRVWQNETGQGATII